MFPRDADYYTKKKLFCQYILEKIEKIFFFIEKCQISKVYLFDTLAKNGYFGKINHFIDIYVGGWYNVTKAICL